jgi:hypothetical protein
MGDIADMVLEGILSEDGEFIGDELLIPMGPRKTNCKVCGKRIKEAGLTDHMRDVHGPVPKKAWKRGDKPCVVCGKPGAKRMDIKTNWFRGDDVVVNVCSGNVHTEAQILATEQAKKQL